MHRYLPLFLAILLILLSSCTGKQTSQSDTASENNQARDSGQSASMGSGGSTPPGQASEDMTSEQKVELADNLLKQGDVDSAIEVLENMSATAPDFEGLKERLIQSHLTYALNVSLMRTIP